VDKKLLKLKNCKLGQLEQVFNKFILAKQKEAKDSKSIIIDG